MEHSEKNNFYRFHDTKRLLNTDNDLKLIDGETVDGEIPRSRKRFSVHGIAIQKELLLRS